LYTFPNNPRAFKALIAAEYAGVKVDVVQDAPEFALGVTNTSPEFLAKFPFGNVPAFEAASGLCLSEPNAIATFLTEDKLGGHSVAEKALIQQWSHFSENEIVPHACTWVYPTLGYMQFNKPATDNAKQRVAKVLAYLDTILEKQTFLVGDHVSLADIAVVCDLLALYQRVLDPEFRAPYTNTTRWFTTCVNQPQFRAVLGEVTLAETMAQFDAEAFAALNPKAVSKKSAKKAEPKKQEKKKEQKPKEPSTSACEPEDELDEAEAIAKAEAKVDPVKEYLATLPKPKMSMDAWKKFYSNNESIDALKYLWENCDLENHSFWKGDYADDLLAQGYTKTFMTMNLVSGMCQRLDPIRKVAFGNVCVFGKDKENEISGVWMWHGHDFIFDKTQCNVDSPSYKWRKLDPCLPEDKKLIEQYFSWGEVVPLDDHAKAPNQWECFK